MQRRPTPEEKVAWKKKMEKREFILYSIIIPMIISALVSPVVAVFIVKLLAH